MKTKRASGKRRSISLTRAVWTGDLMSSGLLPPLEKATCNGREVSRRNIKGKVQMGWTGPDAQGVSQAKEAPARRGGDVGGGRASGKKVRWRGGKREAATI